MARVSRISTILGYLEKYTNIANYNEMAYLNHNFKIYVAAMTPKTENCISSFREFCDRELEGKYDISIISIMENPQLAEGDRVIATPTIIKNIPSPVRRVIGNLSNVNKLCAGLGLNYKN